MESVPPLIRFNEAHIKNNRIWFGDFVHDRFIGELFTGFHRRDNLLPHFVCQNRNARLEAARTRDFAVALPNVNHVRMSQRFALENRSDDLTGVFRFGSSQRPAARPRQS